MNKQVPGIGKILVMVGFALSCFGLLLFLWLAFGGPTPLKPKGYRFQVSFGEATQLAKEADVRISGVPVGKVKDITTNQQTGRSDATIEMQSPYAPVRQDAKAILRQKTLLGETYVELTPGSPTARSVPDGGRLGTSQVSPTVELDEIFRAFDPKTRAAFDQWMQQQALSINGRGQDLSDALGNLAPFAEDTTQLLTVLNSQKAAVRQLVRNTGVVFDALSQRGNQLSSLITNSNKVFATTAARDQQLAETFRALPTFERESKTTVERLTQFAKNANPVTTQLRPAARELSPTLVKLSQLAPDLKAFFRDLNPLIDASKSGLPATEQFLRQLQGLLPEFDGPLKQLNPVLDGAGLYKNELTAFFANSVAATQAAEPAAGAKDLVHYLRTTNPLSPETLAQYAKRLPTNRPNPYPFPGSSLGLKDGLQVFENRHCTADSIHIDVSDPVDGILNAALRNNVIQFALNGGNVVAPPCKLQPRYNIQGNVTRYPQVGADVKGLQPGPPTP